MCLKNDMFNCIMVNEYFVKESEGIDRDKVRYVSDKARLLDGEVFFHVPKNKTVQNNDTLKRKSITTPKLVIKYHKNKNSNDEFPTRLVIQSRDSTAKFSKVVCLGMKELLNNHMISYLKYTIKHASQVK